MAFFSLTGWAETNINTATVAVQSIEYGGYSLTNPATHLVSLNVQVFLNAKLEEGVDYTVDDAFYTDEACTTPVKDGENNNITNFSLLPVSTSNYYVKISGMGTFNGFTSGAFTVTKRTLTVSVKDAAFFVKNYLEPDPEFPEAPALIEAGEGDYSVSGLIGTDAIADVLTVATDGTAGYTYEGENANATTAGVLFAEDAGYPVTFQGFSLTEAGSNNYQLAFAERVMKIKQVAITIGDESPFTVTANNDGEDVDVLTDNKVYDGEAYEPTFTLKYTYGRGTDNTLGTEDDLVYTLSASDFDLNYYVGADVKTPINVADYAAKVTGKITTIGEESVQHGNFFTAAAVEVGTFSITKKTVDILVNPKTKTYDGDAYAVADAAFTIAGLATRDEGNVKDLAATCDALPTANVGEYNMGVDATGAYIKIGTENIDFTTNYNVNPLVSKWTINPRAITITAASKTAAKGATVPTSELTVTGNIGEADEATILAAYKIDNALASTDAFGTIDNAYVPTRKVAADYGEEGAAKVTAANEFLANYTIVDDPTTEEVNEASPALVNGSLTVSAGGFTIMPVIADTEYSGVAVSPAFYAFDGANTVTLNADNIAYEYKKTSEAETAYKDEAPKTIGSYNVRVKEGTVTGTDNYAGVEISYPAVQFSITPKVLNITVNDVYLHNGDTEETLQSHGSVDATSYTCAAGESLSFKYKFVTPTPVGLTIDATTKKITFAADIANAVTAELKDGDFNDNYEVTFTTANLKLAAPELVLDVKDADLLQKITEADGNDQKYNVTFGTKTMKGKEWYAMVLPFNTSAKELVKVLDTYVVVNTLSANSTDQKFKFTLEMGEIEAGHPFIIKPEAAIDLGEIVPAVLYANVAEYNTANGTELSAEQFAALTDAEKTITPAHPKFVFEDKTINSVITPYGVDGTIKIYGTYESQILGVDGKPAGEGADITDRSWWLSDTDYEATVVANDWRKPKNKPHTLAPMEAYLVAAEGWTTYAPVITVEDFDGQTTAIKTLNADKINGLNVSEGWYNLNGVKLQSAPTQKGVYINNGKKVIIK